MADFGSELIEVPSSSKKRKWTDTALLVFLGVVIFYFLFNVISSTFMLIFQKSMISK